MSEKDIIRAWKDEEYRERLGEAALEGVPENPAGTFELLDTELIGVSGGTLGPVLKFSWRECTKAPYVIAAAKAVYDYGSNYSNDCGPPSYQVFSYDPNCPGPNG